MKCLQETQHWPKSFRILFSPFCSEQEKRAQAESADPPDDWDLLARFLGRQRLLTIVLPQLQRLGYAAPPPPIAEACRAAYDRNRRRAEDHLRVLKSILDAAERDGLPLMVMRTPYLIEALYQGDYGCRRMSDIDLAVLPGSLDRFAKLLSDTFPDVCLSSGDPEKNLRKAQCGSRMELTAAGVHLDVHWDLALFYNFHRSPRRARLQEDIWEHAREMQFAWGKCRVMSNEDLVAHLAEHLVIQHDLSGVCCRGVLEYAHAAAALDIDAERLERLASVRGSITALRTSAYATRMILEVPENAPLLGELASRTPRLVAARTRRCIAAATRTSGHGTRSSFFNSLARTFDSVVSTAVYADGADTRLALLRMFSLPSRQMLSYALDRTLSKPRYLLYLALMPLALPLLMLCAGTCAVRQWEELREGLKRRGAPQPPKGRAFE